MNCHLPAHAEKFAERERDLKKILFSLDLPKELPIRQKHRGKRTPKRLLIRNIGFQSLTTLRVLSLLFSDVTCNYDFIFLCGDLNFRINKSREDVIDFISKTWGETSPVDFQPELTNLLEADQLKHSLANSIRINDFVILICT